MARETIPATLKISGNTVTVILNDAEILDNSQYEIRLKDLKSLDGKASLEDLNYKVVTELTPAYCNISDVAILTDTFADVPESMILYYIREASKYVDYIRAGGSSGTSSSSTTSDEITFPMREFVKIKATIDCLTKAYVNKAAGSGIKGKLGEISFENTEKYATSLNDLLDDLWDQLKKWEDALKGYELEGRAQPQYAIRGSEATDVTSFSNIVDTIERDLPENLPT